MNTEKITQILGDLVAFQTVTGKREAALGCLGYIEAYLMQRGLHMVRHEYNGYPSLIATTHETKRPKLLLQAHIDVVAAPDHCFNLQKKDEKLLGRGVFDMKFAAAAFMKVVDELQEKLQDYDFGIMITSDEELGGKDGVRALLDAGYGADVCVLPDGGDNWAIETTHKGCWIGRMKTKGTAAHGSRPWEGDNAIDRLVDALRDIRKMFEEQHVDSDTLSINKISGGAVINQVADNAEAALDMRFISDQNFEKLYKQIEAVAEGHKASLETVVHIPITKTDINDPFVASFMQIAENIRGGPLKQSRSLGVSDARFFAERGIPVILLRPAGGSAHGDNEWIDKAGLEQYCQILKAYIEEVCGP